MEMYTQWIKVICQPGEEDDTKLALDHYIKAAKLNPGFVHGSYIMPEAHPGGETPSGFGIKDRDRTFFVYVAFRTPRDMLRHVENYHGDQMSLLPSPHDYMLGSFIENENVDVDNLYE